MSGDDDKRPSGSPLQRMTMLALVTGLLFVGYGGVYYSLVDRTSVWIHPTYFPPSLVRVTGMNISAPLTIGGDMLAEYPRVPRWIPSSLTTKFFQPIHWVDRRLRPEYWSGAWPAAVPVPVPGSSVILVPGP